MSLFRSRFTWYREGATEDIDHFQQRKGEFLSSSRNWQLGCHRAK